MRSKKATSIIKPIACDIIPHLSVEELCAVATYSPVANAKGPYFQNIGIICGYIDKKTEISIKKVDNVEGVLMEGSLLVSVLLGKIPEDVRLQIGRKMKDGHWELGLLLDLLQAEIENREWFSGIQASLPSALSASKLLVVKQMPSTASTILTSGRMPSCTYCKENHACDLCKIVTDLIILHCHNVVTHNRTSEILAELHQNHWVPSERQLVRKSIHNCRICKWFKGVGYRIPRPADLPQGRVQGATVFVDVGIDFAGPLYVMFGDEFEEPTTPAYLAIGRRILNSPIYDVDKEDDYDDTAIEKRAQYLRTLFGHFWARRSSIASSAVTDDDDPSHNTTVVMSKARSSESKLRAIEKKQNIERRWKIGDDEFVKAITTSETLKYKSFKSKI
eukprot:gene5784-11069_t